jgi:type III secretory pathway component EscU
MPRIVISLNDAEKDRLTRLAEAERVPITEIVHRASALYRRQSGEHPNFDGLLE